MPSNNTGLLPERQAVPGSVTPKADTIPIRQPKYATRVELANILEAKLESLVCNPRWHGDELIAICPAGHSQKGTQNFGIRFDGEHAAVFNCFVCGKNKEPIRAALDEDWYDLTVTGEDLGRQERSSRTPARSSPAKSEGSEPRTRKERKPKSSLQQAIDHVVFGLQQAKKDKNGKILIGKGGKPVRPADDTWHHVQTWKFPDPNDREDCFEARFENSQGQKEYRPIHVVHAEVNGTIVKQYFIGDPPRPKLPLYGRPALKSKPKRVYFVEGPKSAEAVQSLGLAATTTLHGAQSPQKSDQSDLDGIEEVVIAPDNDEPGLRYCNTLCGLLGQLLRPPAIRVLCLPGLAEGEDVYDWIAAKRGQGWRDAEIRVEFERLADQVPVKSAEELVAAENESLDCRLSKFKRTDLGNAERFVARHGKDIRYCHPWKKWLCWDGQRWRIDDTGTVRRWARNTVRGMLGEAMTLEKSDDREALVEWQQKSEDKRRIAAMLTLAEAEQGIPILPNVMDRDPWLFNCANGTIDLKTGRLRPHNREDFITKLCPHNFIPGAKCPLFLSTLDTFLKRPDPAKQMELITYLKRIGGYCLTGVVEDHILPVAHGDGSNGKSTYLMTMLDTWGPDYAMKANQDLLLASKGDKHPTDKADLFGKRLVIAIETDQDRRLNESLIKELTGGDAIRARRMREDFWEFMPTHKAFMAVNHEPRVRGTDHGIWRRIKKIPFTICMPDGKADKAMPRKLKKEAEGILAWFVEGCLEWQREGLATPEEVIEATNEYRAKQDSIGRFLEECTERGPSLRVRASELYSRYKEWAAMTGEHAESQRLFGIDLGKRGFESTRSGGIVYLRIALAPKDDELADLKRWLAAAISAGMTSVSKTIDAASAGNHIKRRSDGELATAPIFESARSLGYKTEGPDGAKIWVKIEEAENGPTEEVL